MPLQTYQRPNISHIAVVATCVFTLELQLHRLWRTVSKFCLFSAVPLVRGGPDGFLSRSESGGRGFFRSSLQREEKVHRPSKVPIIQALYCHFVWIHYHCFCCCFSSLGCGSKVHAESGSVWKRAEKSDEGNRNYERSPTSKYSPALWQFWDWNRGILYLFCTVVSPPTNNDIYDFSPCFTLTKITFIFVTGCGCNWVCRGTIVPDFGGWWKLAREPGIHCYYTVMPVRSRGRGRVLQHGGLIPDQKLLNCQLTAVTFPRNVLN